MHLKFFLRSIGSLLFISSFFLFTGCPPTDTTPACVEGLPVLQLGEYCSPTYLDLPLADEAVDQELPTCDGRDYTNSLSFYLDVPASGVVYLHRFRDFPGEVIMEYIGTNCEADDYKLLSDCEQSGTGNLVKIDSIRTKGYSTLIVRAIYKITSTEVEDPSLSFAAFAKPFVPEVIYQSGSREPIPVDCQGRPFSFIMSPGAAGTDPVQEAQALGLRYESCNCAANIVKVNLPQGVDLDAVRPKVPKSKVESDTTRFSYNFIIPIPADPAIETNDPNEAIFNPKIDTNIIGNGCLDWKAPLTKNSGALLRIAIVDSGVDLGYMAGELAGKFSPVQSQDTCLSTGVYGYDFVDNDNEPNDQVGHGTMVATAFLSHLDISYPLSLGHYKFLDTQAGTLFDALCATASAIEAGNELINLSWGFYGNELPAALEYVFDLAEAEKALLVVSAGNDTLDVVSDSIYWPAAAGKDYPYVLTVGSYYLDGAKNPVLAPYSNYNSEAVGIAAIYSTEAITLGGFTDYPSGTSISAPIVLRALAAYHTPGADPLDALQKLLTDGRWVEKSPSTLSGILLGYYLKVPPPGSGCAF